MADIDVVNSALMCCDATRMMSMLLRAICSRLRILKEAPWTFVCAFVCASGVVASKNACIYVNRISENLNILFTEDSSNTHLTFIYIYNC